MERSTVWLDLSVTTIERLLSLSFAVGVAAYAVYLHPTSLVLNALIQLALPIAAIWYSDELSNMTGHGKSDSVTPAILIRVLGWILLLLTPFGVYLLKFRLELTGH